MVVLDGDFALGCGPRTDCTSICVRTNTRNNERVSRTNNVRSSIPHCIYDTVNCIISRSNALVNNTIKLLDINKAVNCLHVCNFKSTNTMLYCKPAGRQAVTSQHDIHKQLFSKTSRRIVSPTRILSSGGSSSTGWTVELNTHVHLVLRLRMYWAITKLAHILTPFTRNSLSSEMTRRALGPTQPPIRWGPGLFPGNKAAEAWRSHLIPSIAKVKNEWSYTSTSLYAIIVWTRKTSPFYLRYVIIYCQQTGEKMKIQGGLHAVSRLKSQPVYTAAPLWSLRSLPAPYIHVFRMIHDKQRPFRK
jgi:hypothetical protein